MLEVKITELIKAIDNHTMSIHELTAAMKIKENEVYDGIVQSKPRKVGKKEVKKKIEEIKKEIPIEAKKEKETVEATQGISTKYDFDDIREIAKKAYSLFVDTDKMVGFVSTIHKYTKNETMDIKLVDKKDYDAFKEDIEGLINGN